MVSVFGEATPFITKTGFIFDATVTAFVQWLRVGVFVSTSAMFELDNVTKANGHIDAGMLNGLISIEYVCQIPEPRVYVLAFGVMAGILVWMRRRK